MDQSKLTEVCINQQGDLLLITFNLEVYLWQFKDSKDKLSIWSHLIIVLLARNLFIVNIDLNESQLLYFLSFEE